MSASVRGSLIPPDEPLGHVGDADLSSVRGLFRPYAGDLFGTTSQNNSGGMLYLSRMDPTRNPLKTSRLKADYSRKGSSEFSPSITRERCDDPSESKKRLNDERRWRMAISLHSMCSQVSKRAGVVEKGGLLVLSQLSRSSDGRTRHSCACAYNSLAGDPSLRRTMVDAGSSGALKDLILNSSNRSLHRECLEALCKLASLQGSESDIMKAGVISAALMVQRLQPALLDITLKLLINLSFRSSGPGGGWHDAKLDELNEAMMQLSSAVDESSEIQTLFVKFLCNLSCFSKNQQTLIEDGALRMLVDIFEDISGSNFGSSEIPLSALECLQLCAKTLCNLSVDARSRIKLCERGPTSMLMKMLDMEDAQIRNDVAKTVSRLAHEQDKILQTGMMDAILRICGDKRSDAMTVRTCTHALHILSIEVEFASALVQSGATAVMLALIKRSSDRLTQRACGMCLSQLVRSGFGLQEVLAGDGIKILAAVADPQDDEVSEACTLALLLLFRYSQQDRESTSSSYSGPSAADSRDIMNTLIDICRCGGYQLRRHCIGIIWQLTLNDPNVPGVHECIPVLLEMLQGDSDATLKADCAGALFNIAQSPDNARIMMEAGALSPVLRLATSGSFETKVECTSILQRLLVGNLDLPEVSSSSFVSNLLRLGRLEHRATQQRIVIACYHLSCIDSAQLLLLKCSAPAQMSRLIGKPSEIIRKGCAAVLLNLSSIPGSEKAIMESCNLEATSITSSLLICALVATDSDETRHICAHAITNLLHDDSLHSAMARDGVIWGLATLSKTNDMDVQRNCMRALCNISYTYWQDVLTNKCIEAIADLTGSRDLCSAEAGICALSNALRGSFDRPKRQSTAKVPGIGGSFSAGGRESIIIAGKEAIPRALIRGLQHAGSSVHARALHCVHTLSKSKQGLSIIAAHSIVRQITLDEEDEELCFVYTCIVRNMAVDPATRSAVIQSGVLDDFADLCTLRSCERVRTAIAQTCYVLSCSSKPDERADSNLCGIVSALLSDQHPEVEEPCRSLVSALLFNLSNDETLRTQLVAEKAARNAYVLWKSGVPHICRQASLTVCNLALGRVNTATMVLQKAGTIIVDLATVAIEEEDFDICLRVSAALRNLLCVSGNHEQLVAEGVIPCLVQLGQLQDRSIQHNSASALRSLTCKANIRKSLVEHRATDVILHDAAARDNTDDIYIQPALLSDIEAESWVNGTRGVLAEKRAEVLPQLQRLELNKEWTQSIVDAAPPEIFIMNWPKQSALGVILDEPESEQPRGVSCQALKNPSSGGMPAARQLRPSVSMGGSDCGVESLCAKEELDCPSNEHGEDNTYENLCSVAEDCDYAMSELSSNQRDDKDQDEEDEQNGLHLTLDDSSLPVITIKTERDVDHVPTPSRRTSMRKSIHRPTSGDQLAALVNSSTDAESMIKTYTHDRRRYSLQSRGK